MTGTTRSIVKSGGMNGRSSRTAIWKPMTVRSVWTCVPMPDRGLMQALGVDIQTIQSIVGHADTEMTEHYLHVQESIRQSAIQLFSEAFSA